MHWGLPYSKEMLEFVNLHEVVPQATLRRPSPWAKNLHATVPTCDENFTNEFEQDNDLNHSIQVLLLSFIFFLERA
jgi:hypothetical protein